MRRYKNKKTYLNAKKRKEYNRYLRNYRQKRKKLEDKGLTPYDSIEYSYQEYFTLKKSLQEDGYDNIQRNLIQKQLYKYSYETVMAMRKAAREKNRDDILELSVEQFRTGEDFDLDFLSDINEALKEEHPEWTGKGRAKWIRKEWFGYAS